MNFSEEMKSPTNLFFSAHCSGVENLPSRLIYSMCWTAEIFVPLGFLSDFIRKWNIANEEFSPFESQPQVQGAKRLAYLFVVFSCQDARFLAFHFVKCISEHFQQNLLCLILPLPQKSACTIFAQIFGHSMTNQFRCAIVFCG